MREFNTGATRDNDTKKLDYEGFLSPYFLEAFGEYMHTNRVQADGKLRDSDNWQRGIPLDSYMKSMFRHFMEAWKLHREAKKYGRNAAQKDEMILKLCAIFFNVQGYGHELLIRSNNGQEANISENQTVCPDHDKCIPRLYSETDNNSCGNTRDNLQSITSRVLGLPVRGK